MQDKICVDKHGGFALPWVIVAIHFCRHEPHKTDVCLFPSASNKADIAAPDQHCTDTIAVDRLKTITSLKKYTQHLHMPLGFSNSTLFTFPQRTVWKLVTLLTSFEQTYLIHWSTELGLCSCLRLLFLYKISVTTILGLFHVIAHPACIFLLCFTA